MWASSDPHFRNSSTHVGSVHGWVRPRVASAASAASIFSLYGQEHLSGDPVEIVSRLDARGIEHAYVDGGITIQRFLRAGLIQHLNYHACSSADW
jgi:hypothetical protein